MIRILCLVLCGFCFLLSSCLSNLNYGRLIDAGSTALQAATVSDSDLVSASMQMRQQMDSTSQVAGDKDKYTRRLKKVMAKETNVNGVPLNYKVYMTPELNANATPDGSIRVNSGLMDAMNDDELRFVLGHEIGHVARGHSLNAMRMSYATAAARTAAGAISPVAGRIADSSLADMAHEFIKAQFSQSQELDADSYGMDFLKKNGYNPDAAISAMRKLGSGGGGFFSTHPSNEKRIQNLEALKNGADPSTLKTDS